MNNIEQTTNYSKNKITLLYFLLYKTVFHHIIINLLKYSTKKYMK